MFRPMRRFKQQIADSKCKEILKNEKRGILSLLGDDGYPYGLPLSHLYTFQKLRHCRNFSCIPQIKRPNMVRIIERRVGLC